MIDYPALQPYAERYAEIETEPLQVTLILRSGSQLAGYDPLNLDNLLAYCVVQEASEGRGLPHEPQDAYRLPTPLKCLWRDGQGFPLWACTPFMPENSINGVSYWHKRQQSGEWTGTQRGTLSITSTKGRYMERRVPLPIVTAERWTATCIGNADEIARLLSSLAFVGKKRSTGFGEVKEWRIDSGEFALVRDEQLTRSFPAMAIELLDGQVPEGAPAPVGWTPPQWKPALFAPGWWPKTDVTMDWFATADAL